MRNETMRWISFLVVGMMALGTWACDSDSNDDESTDTDSGTGEEDATEGTLTVSLTNGMEGIKFQYSIASGDTTTEDFQNGTSEALGIGTIDIDADGEGETVTQKLESEDPVVLENGEYLVAFMTDADPFIEDIFNFDPETDLSEGDGGGLATCTVDGDTTCVVDVAASMMW